LALFGIATDDGVIMATYLDQQFSRRRPETATEARQLTVAAARRRIRPALMTTATTLLALLPILTSTGRGVEIMVPMAVPVFGGMLVAVLTVFVVPVLYCAAQESGLQGASRRD
jgi:Cu(I)/Ag(I) efflux system membrane protein CusA/SilA